MLLEFTWFPKMVGASMRYCGECSGSGFCGWCKKGAKRAPRMSLRHIHVTATGPFRVVATDVMELPPCNGFRYLVTFMDAFT